MLYEEPICRLMADRAVLVDLGDEINPTINDKVRELFISLDQMEIAGVIDLIPSYRSLLLIYDPLQISSVELENQINNAHKRLDPAHIPSPKTVEIPVVYGDDYGPDLEWVAAYHKIAPQEVNRLHTQQPFISSYISPSWDTFVYRDSDNRVN